MLIRPQKYAQNNNHQTKSRKSGVQPQKKWKKQANKQQERAKNRSETNKSPDPELTPPPDSKHRANSEPERTQTPEHRAKKRGV